MRNRGRNEEEKSMEVYLVIMKISSLQRFFEIWKNFNLTFQELRGNADSSYFLLCVMSIRLMSILCTNPAAGTQETRNRRGFLSPVEYCSFVPFEGAVGSSSIVYNFNEVKLAPSF